MPAAEIDDAGARAALLWNVAGKSELELWDLKAGRSIAKPKLPTELAGGLEVGDHQMMLTMDPPRPASTMPRTTVWVMKKMVRSSSKYES